MDTSNAGTPRTGALFIDLENIDTKVGYSFAANERIDLLLTSIKQLLIQQLGIELFVIWATARLHSEKRSIGPYRIALKNVIKRHGGKIDWCLRKTADENLIQKVETWLEAGTLPETIILISGDGDFTQLVRKVRATRRYVVVIAPNSMSARLRESANVAFELSELVPDLND